MLTWLTPLTVVMSLSGDRSHYAPHPFVRLSVCLSVCPFHTPAASLNAFHSSSSFRLLVSSRLDQIQSYFVEHDLVTAEQRQFISVFRYENISPFELLFSGLPGLAGAQGQKGQSGFIGVAGATGSQGDAGWTGWTGPGGDTGWTGWTGGTGVVGDTGTEGTIGQRGLRGPTGQQGRAGSIGQEGVPGFTGFQGPRGFTGATGLNPQDFFLIFCFVNCLISTVYINQVERRNCKYI